ncbi:MAG: AAA family ATPase [Sulfolobales archaeon]
MEFKLHVRSFKSIREAQLDIKPVTLLVGPPGSGKSNTLEALGFLTYLAYGGDPSSYFRWSSLSSLSYMMVEPQSLIEIDAGRSRLTVELKFNPDRLDVLVKRDEATPFSINYNYQGYPTGWSIQAADSSILYSLLRVRFYRFTRAYELSRLGALRFRAGVSRGFVIERIQERSGELYDSIVKSTLLPPHGDNLVTLFQYNKEIADIVVSVLTGLVGCDDVVLTLTPSPGGPPLRVISLIRRIGESGERITVSIPLELISEGILQYLITLISLNVKPPEDIPRLLPDIVLLEEPEIHMFPYLIDNMVKDLLRAAEDGVYTVISTHNPYLLVRSIEKIPEDKLAVYYTYHSKARESTSYIKLLHEDLEEMLEEEYASLYTIEDLLEKRGVRFD